MIHLAKGNKYIAANVLLVALAFAAAQFLLRSNGPHPKSGQNALVFAGIILYLAVSTVVIARAYYRGGRFQFLDKTRLETEVTTEALIGADRLRTITITLPVSSAGYTALLQTGMLVLKPSAFKTPIRPGDIVTVTASDAARSRTAKATIDTIDGYNQTVSLRLAR